MTLSARSMPRVVAIVLILCFSCCSAFATAPALFYSDITSGPKTGGEGGNGAHVCVYGMGFGSTRGSSAVTVGGGPVSSYTVWHGATMLDGTLRTTEKVCFQLGASAATGSIIMTVGGVSSNALPFTVRAGNIFFVNQSSGSNGNSGAVASPWQTIQWARDHMAPGDITYVRNGYLQNTGSGEDDFSACFAIGGPAGTSGNPLALIVYPGESATIGTTIARSSGGCDSGIRTKGQGEQWWVMAGWHLIGFGEAFTAFALNHWRLIGNDATCPVGDGPSACFTWGPGTDVAAYGNRIFLAGKSGASALYHGIYLADQNTQLDIGWNVIEDVRGCRGIQFNSSTSFDEADIKLHDNVIHDTVCDGIIMATVNPATGAGVSIFNNIIYNAGKGPEPPDGGGAFFCLNIQGYSTEGGTTGTFQVYSNTMFNCGTFASPPFSNANGGISVNGPNPNKKVQSRNNLIYLTPGSLDSSHIAYLWIDKDGSNTFCAGTGACTRYFGSNNLFFNDGAAPAYSDLTSSVNSNPSFISTVTPDFHLSSGASPAATSGATTPQATDFNGVSLPQGAGYPIGAMAFDLGGGGGGGSVGGIQRGGPRTTAGPVTRK